MNDKKYIKLLNTPEKCIRIRRNTENVVIRNESAKF